VVPRLGGTGPVSPTTTLALILADSHKQLPGVFNSLEPTLRHYGYLAVGGILFLEDFGVPLPGETMLIAASLYAGTGSLNIWLVGLVAVIGAVAGDNVGFAIGHFGGRKLIDRFGKYVFLTPKRLDKVEDFFRRHGSWVVVIARFVEGLRQANGLIAGTVEMPWLKFLAANVIGAVAWVTLWATLGYFAGNHVETISKYATYVAIGIAVLVIAVIARHLIAHRRERTADAA
jgi:membrane protein DedA with SNARE-associated domain